eukprot:CAMPEP_0178990604 /NCGR_PEP_ID=MMETSP0795-20121207/5053_1 /TAXON_ID=88552 /ORGANISM="Amoebophrya sp., Strain Ameob2" /LENGTH=42 /DNA_ID= /DNA_START= /DNA_END= /DNA_ORIENTATION=
MTNKPSFKFPVQLQQLVPMPTWKYELLQLDEYNSEDAASTPL